VREEKTRHVPYKCRALGTRKGGEGGEKESSIHRDESLAIVLVPAEKEQPEISQKLRGNRQTHYLLSSFISRIEKTK
jgi:hypothetical protein